MRIVSLLPSATEIVYALGQGASLVGVSHECDYPPDANRKPRMIETVFDNTRIGSQEVDALVAEHMKEGKSIYRIKFDELKRADPDLIITQELCDVCAVDAADVLEVVNRLGKPISVLSLNPHTLADVKGDIRNVAEAMRCMDEAEPLIASLEAKVNYIKALTANAGKVRAFCVEWLKPLMNAGHWIPELLDSAGGLDELAVRGRPSGPMDWPRVVEYDPEVVVLMPCGFTTERTVQEAPRFLELPRANELTAIRNHRLYATDGHNYFSRSGPRLFDAVAILAQMLHPELFNAPMDPKLGTRVELPA